MDASESSESVPERSRSRKKARNPAEWKRNVQKRKRNSGEEYVSRSTGRVMKAYPFPILIFIIIKISNNRYYDIV